MGLVLSQRLLQRFGGPAAVFQASLRDLTAVKGITPALAQAIVGFRDWDKLEESLARLASLGVEMVTRDDPRFPARLKEIPYPPPYLFIRGTLAPEDGLAVAMVGTRGASYYGLKAGRRLAGALAARGGDGGERPGPGHRHRRPPGGVGNERPHPGGTGLRPGRHLPAGKP